MQRQLKDFIVNTQQELETERAQLLVRVFRAEQELAVLKNNQNLH